MENELSWLDKIIIPRTQAYKNFIKEMEDTPSEQWMMDGERIFTEKEEKFLKIYNYKNGIKEIPVDFLAKKSGLEVTPFIFQESIKNTSQNPTNFSSRYEEEMEATRSGFSIEDVIPEEDRLRNKEITGKISFMDFDGTIADVMEYTSTEEYLKDLKEVLFSNPNGFKYETLHRDPELLKTVDDLIYGEYGEDNPNSLDWYIEKIKNEQNNNNQNPKIMETQKEFDQVQYLKDQLKYLGFGEDVALHKDLEKGIGAKKLQFEIKTISDKTLLGNNVDFTLHYNKTEKGGIFLNSYDANLTSEKGDSISQNFRVSRENSFTAKEAINLLEGRSVKIEFHNPKTNEREPAFVKLNFDDGKNQYGNYNFQTFYKNYGVNTADIIEKSNLIFDKPEFKADTIKSLEKGNVVKVKFEQDGNVTEAKAVLNPQYKNLNLYDNDMNRINTNKPLEGLEQDNKHEKNNVREQSIKR